MIPLATASVLTIVSSAALLFAGARFLTGIRLRNRVLATIPVLAAYAVILRWQPGWWPVGDAAVLAVALAVGTTIGSTIRSTPAIIAFCMAAAVVDVMSFSGGLTCSIVESYRAGDSRLLISLSIAVPVAGTVRPIVGIGDLIILSGLFTGFRHLGYGGWLPFAAPLAGLLVALAVGLAWGGVPALPFIAGTTVAYVWIRGRLRRRA